MHRSLHSAGPLLALLIAIALPTMAWGQEAQPEEKPGETSAGPANTASVPGYQDLSTLGASNSTAGQLRSDNQAKDSVVHPGITGFVLSPYYKFKGWLKEELGLAFGVDYAALYQYGAPSAGQRNAASGVFRMYGDWALVGGDTPDKGTLTFKVESRHSYTDTAPQALASQVGYAGFTAITFSAKGWVLTNLFWHQALLDNHLGFIIGFVDVTDYVDVYSLVNPWTDFSNAVFSTDPTIPAPSQGLGLAVRGTFCEQFYVIAGLADSNGSPGNPFADFTTFVSANQFFKHVEVGWFDTWEHRDRGNVHVTAWQSDARSQQQIPSGWGIAASASHLVAKRWLPFLRLGFGDGGAGALLEQSVGVGTGYKIRDNGDLLAAGFNWGRPSAKTFGPGLRDQLTIEAFYRLQLLQHLALTPDLQILVQPALQPDLGVVVVMGIRARAVF